MGEHRSSAQFAGKMVVVTRAGHGIGRASAGRFAADGATEGLVVDANAAAAKETMNLITEGGRRAHTVVADVFGRAVGRVAPP